MIDATTVERTYEGGLALIDRGLPPFLIRRDDSGGKIPIMNCANCFIGGCGGPPCECLTCHGFYAGTLDPDRWLRLVEAAPAGFLAFRTGVGALVIDFEREALEGERPHVWADLELLPPTLTAATPGGGRHLVYGLPADGEPVVSRNRILPFTDVKAEGGYVAAPGGRRIERRWLEPDVPITAAPAELLAFLRVGVTARSVNGAPISAPDGYNYAAFIADGPRSGCREFFFNDLAYRQRRNGRPKSETLEQARRLWERCEQPRPDGSGARWYMPWRDVEYKIERVYRTIEPDVPDPALVALGRRIAGSSRPRPGRVTIGGLPRE